MHTQQVIRVFATRLRLASLAVAGLACALGVSEVAVSTAAAEVPASTTTVSAAYRADVADTAERAEKGDKAASAFDADSWDAPVVRAINPQVLRLALGASRCAVASGDVRQPSTLTIIDYSKPSVEPRLWVLDLDSRALVYEELVSHGQGSGGNLATKFSNQPDSHQTSIGLFVTEQTYVGRNGYSLRLNGLDKGFNDRARERAIVMHGAPYVNSTISKSLGRLGRSHGCPAVRDAVARELIDRVKGGSLVFSYYPDAEWLKHSKYLGTCGN
jgi:hypothetical protein